MQLSNTDIDKIKEVGIMLSVKEASKLLKCSRNKFTAKYVDTGLIEPLYINGYKHPKFSFFDVVEIPEKIKERQEASRNSKHNYSKTEIAFQTAMGEI